MRNLNTLERRCYWTLSNYHENNIARLHSADFIAEDSILQDLCNIFSQAISNANMLEILTLERFAINAEYEHLSNIDTIPLKLHSSRLKILDDALIHLKNCIKDAELIINNPPKYAKGVQDAYGQHRKILTPPAGDTIRKFVNAQTQRLGRLNQGFRSAQKMMFFVARQDALKKLGIIYTQLQCKALGLK